MGAGSSRGGDLGTAQRRPGHEGVTPCGATCWGGSGEPSADTGVSSWVLVLGGWELTLAWGLNVRPVPFLSAGQAPGALPAPLDAAARPSPPGWPREGNGTLRSPEQSVCRWLELCEGVREQSCSGHPVPGEEQAERRASASFPVRSSRQGYGGQLAALPAPGPRRAPSGERPLVKGSQVWTSRPPPDKRDSVATAQAGPSLPPSPRHPRRWRLEVRGQSGTPKPWRVTGVQQEPL